MTLQTLGKTVITPISQKKSNYSFKNVTSRQYTLAFTRALAKLRFEVHQKFNNTASNCESESHILVKMLFSKT